MVKRCGLSFVALLGLLIAAPPQDVGSQVIRYVNRTDSTCGGKTPCYGTIQAAIDAAQPRDSIRIQAGIYSEQLTIEKNNFTGAVEADRIVTPCARRSSSRSSAKPRARAASGALLVPWTR